MYVVKRDGKKESVKFDKITARIVKMCYGLDPLVSPEAVAMKVIEGLFDGVSTTELDNLAAEVAAAKQLITQTMHYLRLALPFPISTERPRKHFRKSCTTCTTMLITKQTKLLRSLQTTFTKSSWTIKKCSTPALSTTATSATTTSASKP